MTRKRFVLAVLSLAGVPAAAHHSPAMFDMTKDVVLEGTVTEVSWRNPHVYFAIEVAEPGGRTRVQQIEAGPVSNFVPLGVGPDSIARGERVVVQSKPNRSPGGGVMLGWLMTKTDGTVIPLHVRAFAPTTPGSTQAAGVAGTWVPQGTGFARLAVTARSWPFTAEGQAATAQGDAARSAVNADCVPFGPPAIMALPAAIRITADDARVTFELDSMDVERTVDLAAREHPANLEPSWLGHSIGRWDGETLVVDTIGFRAHPGGHGFDLASSAAKHVVERFTLGADRKHLEYEATVEDEGYLAAPVTHRMEWDYRPELKPSGLPCDPETAKRFASGE